MRAYRALLPLVVVVTLALGQQRILNAVYMPFRDAAPVLRADPNGLPPGLKGRSGADLRRAWPDWEAATDAAIRQRLVQGEEDGLAELLLFGTSFTDQPRATLADLNSIGSGHPSHIIEARLIDLISNLEDPSGNERLGFSRELLLDLGYSFESPASLSRVRSYLLANLQRVRHEQQLYQDAVAAARLLAVSAPATSPSTPKHGTGLVLETSLLTNYGLQDALQQMTENKLLAPGSVRRVAVIGPGLDFIDRQSGYDTYPEQTVQPFALMDTLFRLKLADPGALKVVTFDISRRVNDHLRNALDRAAQGRPYFIQLPRDEREGWTPGAIAYWEHFGETTGESATAAKLPKAAETVKIRAVRVYPKFVLSVAPVDLNIVLQQLDVPTDAPPFDLVVATNILDYYDVFQQNLALRNIARMLRPGGFLLSNTPLVQIDGAEFRLAGNTFTQYAWTPKQSDRDFWYQRQP